MRCIWVCIALAFIVHKFIQNKEERVRKSRPEQPGPCRMGLECHEFHPLICHIPC